MEKEYEPKRVMRELGQPSKEEIDEHNIDHTPFCTAVGAPVVSVPGLLGHHTRRDGMSSVSLSSGLTISARRTSQRKGPPIASQGSME